jgi:hypothetical protein
MRGGSASALFASDNEGMFSYMEYFALIMGQDELKNWLTAILKDGTSKLQSEVVTQQTLKFLNAFKEQTCRWHMFLKTSFTTPVWCQFCSKVNLQSLNLLFLKNISISLCGVCHTKGSSALGVDALFMTNAKSKFLMTVEIL